MLIYSIVNTKTKNSNNMCSQIVAHVGSSYPCCCQTLESRGCYRVCRLNTFFQFAKQIHMIFHSVAPHVSSLILFHTPILVDHVIIHQARQAVMICYEYVTLVWYTLVWYQSKAWHPSVHTNNAGKGPFPPISLHEHPIEAPFCLVSISLPS